MSGDERYRWLNDVVCTLTGEVRPRSDGSGPDVEYDVAELVWEPARVAVKQGFVKVACAV